MASQVYNRFKQNVGRGSFNLQEAGDDLRVIIVDTNTTADTENDGIEFVANFTTLDEATGANYARKTLDSQTFNEDLANDRAELDATDLSYTALGLSPTTRTAAGFVIYKHVTNDADSPVIAFIDKAFTPDGNDVSVQWNAEGILQFT